MLPRPRLDLSGTTGLRPIGLNPGPWQTSFGLGSMSRYSARADLNLYTLAGVTGWDAEWYIYMGLSLTKLQIVAEPTGSNQMFQNSHSLVELTLRLLGCPEYVIHVHMPLPYKSKQASSIDNYRHIITCSKYIAIQWSINLFIIISGKMTPGAVNLTCL